MRAEEIKQVVAVVAFAVILAVTAVFAASKEAGQPGKAPESGRESIVIEPRVTPVPPVPPLPPTEYGFTADIWADQQVYTVGDLIRINFRVSRPCYVYIFDTDTRGVTHQIFPNYFDPENEVVPGRRYFIPDSTYRLRVTGPPGTEMLRIVAVRYRASLYEDQHQFTPQDPFPTYPEGSRGFLREYQRQEKGPAASATPKSEMRTRRGDEQKSLSPSRKEVSGAEAGARRPESIRVEPNPSPPQTIVVEPGGEPTYDRDYAEAYTTFRVTDPYVQQAPTYGQLDIRSRPSGARVFVDGVFRGYTPVTVNYLPAGIHSVRVELPGYIPFVKEITVPEGRTAVVDVRLRPTGPRWSFDFGFGM